MSKIQGLINYFKFLRNPFSCILFKFGIKKDVLVKFKKDFLIDDVKIVNIDTLDIIMAILVSPSEKYDLNLFVGELESNKDEITICHDINIYNPVKYKYNKFFLEYYMDYYSDFGIDYNNRIIIDIGANVGDTALYFSSQGSKVYAFEPVKAFFDMAKKNFNLNPNLKGKIKIFNYGVSYKKGKLKINSMDSVSDYINKNDSYVIEIISINDILNFVEPDLLKMDCEGCEFEIIKNADLSMFNELIFEYHSEIVGKDYNELIEKLQSQGFKIDVFPVLNKEIDKLGMIHAYKI